MRKIILILVSSVLVVGLVFAESKKEAKQKPEPRIEKLGKVLFLEVIEENWDTFPQRFPLLFEVAIPSPIFDKNRKILKSQESEYNFLRKPKRKLLGLVNHWYKYKGVGRDRESGVTKDLYELPYKFDYEEYNWKKGKGCGLLTFFDVKTIKKMKVHIISYDITGKTKIKIIFDSDELNLILKPMEIWESKIYKKEIVPEDYIDTNFPILKRTLEHYGKLPEKIELSTKITIKNYGLVDGQVRVIP